MFFTRYIVFCILSLIATDALCGTYYGTQLSDWRVVDNSPAGASVNSIQDSVLGETVISTNGAGITNAYMVGDYFTSSGWNNQSEHLFSWRLRTTEKFYISVRVQTTFGHRYLYYNQSNSDSLLHSSGGSIHHGLGSASRDGQWHSWTRNLSADLKDAEPTNTLLAVNGVIVRGNVSVHKLHLYSDSADQNLYSDAENGSVDGWQISDNSPNGAQITNVADTDSPGNRVIQFTSTGLSNSFKHGNNYPPNSWNNTEQTLISWRSKANDTFRVYVRVETTLGWRYLWYDTKSYDTLANQSGTFIHHGLGASAKDGNWHLHSRDLQVDLNHAEPGNTITAVNAMVVRGNMSIDDLKMSGGQSSTPPTPDMPTLSDYELVFNDEFDSYSLDSSKWNTGMLWGPYLQINAEQQLYVDTLGINQGASHSPFSFTGDSLIISADPVTSTLLPPARPGENDPIWNSYPEYRYNGSGQNGPGYDPDDIDYLSGVITSYDSFKMTHGYVEARVKMPAGQGLWPAFWLLNSHYVEDSPEIDVVEFLGHETNKVYHTYHYFDTSNGWQKISTPSYETTGPDWTASFHTFGLVWSPKELIWYVDGVETRRITDADYKLSKQAMYIIANLAVGGIWPGNADATTPMPAEYEIDYIRAYKKKLSPTLDLATDYQLMFSDEFSGNVLDASKWNTSFLWGPYFAINNEEQYYIDINNSDSGSSYSPFSLSNGVLTITADHSSNSSSEMPPAQLPDLNDQIWQDNPQFQPGPYNSAPAYTSGLITSYDSFKFVNGYAEIRAKVPAGDGLWPAFWLLNAYYVGPLPEIDIMEILGENPGKAYHTFHRSNSNGVPLQSQYTSNSATPISGYSDGFHTYGVRWQPGKITWYVDGQIVDTYTESNPGENNAYQLMYVIANLAVGGNFNSQPVDQAAIPAQYQIDYIRVYQEK